MEPYKYTIDHPLRIGGRIWRNTPAGSQFVAILNGKVAGYIGYKNPTGLPTNTHVIELDIGVHPDFQRMGVGKKLLDYICTWAKVEGMTKIAIRVLASNPTAINFYLDNGFIEQGRLVDEFFIDGKYVDDLLFYKKL